MLATFSSFLIPHWFKTVEVRAFGGLTVTNSVPLGVFLSRCFCYIGSVFGITEMLKNEATVN